MAKVSTTLRSGRTGALLPLAAAITLCLGAPARAATISVNDASDDSVPGKCTLSDAVTAVNSSAVKNACAAGDGSNDTIDLSSFAAPTTITFALPSVADPNSALAIGKPATIRAGVDANGNPLVTLTRSTVSGTPNFRLIATSANLSVQGLAFSNGVAPDLGGAINATGTAALTITNSTVSGNRASSSGGGIAADCGDIDVVNSVVSGNTAQNKNGGGIYASNYELGGHCVTSIYLHASKVNGNTATIGNGGGVYSFLGNVYAYYTTVDGNVAGGVYGGGIFAYIDATLFGTTISNNRSAGTGGGLQVSNDAYLSNSTVTGNYGHDGGGSLGAYRLYTRFTTIANNLTGPLQYPLASVTFLQRGYLVSTIITGNAGGNIIGEAPVTGDHNLIGSNIAGQGVTLPPDTINCNPNLGPLADNGGTTKTLALGAGSCAINAGPTFAPAYPSDQRGRKFARRVGAATDIGAFEVQSNDRIFYDGFGA